MTLSHLQITMMLKKNHSVEAEANVSDDDAVATALDVVAKALGSFPAAIWAWTCFIASTAAKLGGLPLDIQFGTRLWLFMQQPSAASQASLRYYGRSHGLRS